MKQTPIETPKQLLETLTGLFPGYSFVPDENSLSEFTYHALLQDFIHYFQTNNGNFTEQQFKSFAVLVDKAIESGGSLENAFGTCFLEHLGQLKARKPLSSFLSNSAKERLRA